MKFRDDDGNEYEVKEKESTNWIHMVIIFSLLLAPSNIIFHGIYIFGDIALLGLLWGGSTFIGNFLKMFFAHNEKGEFTSPLGLIIFVALCCVWMVIVFYAFEKFGIMFKS